MVSCTRHEFHRRITCMTRPPPQLLCVLMVSYTQHKYNGQICQRCQNLHKRTAPYRCGVVGPRRTLGLEGIMTIFICSISHHVFHIFNRAAGQHHWAQCTLIPLISTCAGLGRNRTWARNKIRGPHCSMHCSSTCGVCKYIIEY